MQIEVLTPQQERVLGMIERGLMNKQIAYELGISEATVKAHVSAVLRKLCVRDRIAAAAVAKRTPVKNDMLASG